MYQGGMGFFHSPHGEGFGAHAEGDHGAAGGMEGGVEGTIEGGEHGGFEHGAFEQSGGYEQHGGFEQHGALPEMTQPQFAHGAFGRDQVEMGDEQQQEGGGEQQEGNFAREDSHHVESKVSKQKDVSEKRKQIARPDAKPAKRMLKKSLKKIVKRQVMAAYPRGYGNYQQQYEQGYAPFYHAKKHHPTRVDVDVIGKRSAETEDKSNENHFLF